MVGLFSTASKESQIGVDFLRNGVAVAQVLAGSKAPGSLVRAEFIEANGQEAQVEALRKWVRSHRLQKTPCVCLIAHDDCDVYQVEKVDVDETEMLQAMTWKIKDLINYDVGSAVVDSYPMPASSISSKQQVGVVAAHETVVGSYVDSIKSTAMRLQALDIHDLARSSLPAVRQSVGQNLVLMTFTDDAGLISVYHDTDLYVSREFQIGISRLDRAGGDDETSLDALLLEIQRSLDYFESFYGIAAVNDLRVFPRVEAVELIDPEKMLPLMTQLVYRESKLKLMSLRRRDVRPAIPREEGENTEEPAIYRHVLEIELAGKYADMLGYMRTLEQLDWKLLWDEIEVIGEEYPTITLKLVLSTLSTRKEWIEI